MGRLALIESIPDRLHILEQATSNRTNALVECPYCGKVFERRRAHLRKVQHSACRRCTDRYLRDGAIFIEDIPGRLIVLEQFADEVAGGECLIECPICGFVRLASRLSIVTTRSSRCYRCAGAARSCENSPTYKPLPNTLECIVIDPWAGHDDSGAALALVECPGCGKQRLVRRQTTRESHSTYCRACVCAGERNWNWKGGVRQCRGPGWRDISLFIRERDDWACRLCGSTPQEIVGQLHVHHIVPYRLTKSNSPQNLITLCPVCHIWADRNLDESIPILDEIIYWIYSYLTFPY